MKAHKMSIDNHGNWVGEQTLVDYEHKDGGWIKREDLQKLIDYYKFELESYENPAAYCEREWYIKCDAKAEVLREILEELEIK